MFHKYVGIPNILMINVSRHLHVNWKNLKRYRPSPEAVYSHISVTAGEASYQ